MSADCHRGREGGNGRSKLGADGTANAEGDPSTNKIIASIEACLVMADDHTLYGLVTDAELGNKLTGLVRQLVRASPRRALELGFSSAIELLTTALIRTQAQFIRDVGVHDRAKAGVSDVRRLALPPDGLAMLPLIDFLTRQLAETAIAFSRFNHLVDLGKNKNGRASERKPAADKSVAHDRSRHVGGTNGTHTARHRRR